MQKTQKNIPKILRLDKSPLYLKGDESPFMLNNKSTGINNDGEGNSPYEANYPLCDVEMPIGENHNTGRHYSPITKEMYYWTWNSNGVNFISRVKSDGTCQIVYDVDNLDLDISPEHEIVDFRAYLKVVEKCKNVPGGVLKQLVWVDGSDKPIGMLDVEASIETDSFRSSFFDNCRDNDAYIQMKVPKPQKVITPEIIPYDSTDNAPNMILGIPFKFMYRYVYYDARRSEWSDKSPVFFLGKGQCWTGEIGRCLKFNIPIGNPMVYAVEFAYSVDGGKTWNLGDTIHKYKKTNTTGEYWFNMQFREDVVFVDGGCSLEYKFCNDLLGVRIADADAFRVSDPTPQSPQGFFPINDALAFFNYKKGTCPVDKTEIDKIKITPVCDDTDGCLPKMCDVIVRAVIYNKEWGRNSVIKKSNDGEYFFARRGALDVGSIDEATAAHQVFNDSKNFRIYIEGTSYQAEMEQYFAPGGNLSRAVRMDDNGHDYYNTSNGLHFQKYTFKVKQGTKGFIRMASHEPSSFDRNTSETVFGIYTISLNGQKGDNINIPAIDAKRKELYFDTCGKTEVDISESFLVADHTARNDVNVANGSLRYNIIKGYIYDAEGSPAEGIYFGKFLGMRGGDISIYSDFNGFYHIPSIGFSFSTGGMGIGIEGELNCSQPFEKIASLNVPNQLFDKGVILNAVDIDVTILNEDFNKKSYIRYNVKVNDCKNNPLEGVIVALSGSKYRRTNNIGVASFKLRNYDSRDRVAKSIVMDMSGCIEKDCSGQCNPCMPANSTQLPPCFVQVGPTFGLSIVDGGILVINTEGADRINSGLKHGGIYPFGVVIEYANGKTSPAYGIGNVQMPGLKESGYNFCSLEYDATGLVLPDNAVSMKIVMAENLKENVLQWIITKKEINPNGNIRVSFQSLNDYNSSYDFKTNTKYQFVEGDVFEVLSDGNGALNEPIVYRVISPHTDEDNDNKDDADFFNEILLLPDSMPEAIQEGGIFQISRRKKISENTPYMGIGVSIPVIAGALVSDTGVFNAVDTYFVKRVVASFPVKIFESNYPSDFITYIESGDIYYKNSYEDERRYNRNVIRNSPNIFSYFDGSEKQFDIPEQSGIVAIFLRNGKVGLAICNNGEFTFNVSDNFLRLDGGKVIAAPADSMITDANVAGVNNYGCNYEDIGVICDADAVITWVSVQGYFVVNNFATTVQAALIKTEGGVYPSCGSWFKDRKKGNGFRYFTGFDRESGDVFVTHKKLSSSGAFNEIRTGISENETIVYSTKEDAFTGFASFTPEGYSYIPLGGDGDGTAFVAFLGGIPYAHPVKSEIFNVFFGQPCDWVVGVVLNDPPDKVKIPIAIEINADRRFFVKEITSDVEGDISEIPASYFVEQQENKWNSHFLQNKKSIGGLFQGKNMRGYFIYVIFVRDNTDELEYGTKDSAKMMQGGRLSSILTKVQFSEQSGFIQKR